MRARLPWIVTTISLVIAAVAVTLLLTRGDNSHAPTLTVKRQADCHAETGRSPSAACRAEYDDQIRAACSNSAVAAVEMTVNYDNGPSGPITVVCSASMQISSASSQPESN